MEEAGFQIIRREITWASVERIKGEIDFTSFDNYVDLALEHHLKYLGILAYGNKLYSEKGAEIGGWDGNFYPPDNVEDFANYVYTTVQHYRGKIDMWEIWNEPNGAYRFWRSSFVGDPAGYAKLLESAYKAAKKACPECKVSYAGLFYHQEFIMGAPLFLEKSLEYFPDLGNYFDILAYHPYQFYPPVAAPESGSFPEVPIYKMNQNMLNILKKHGLQKPLWITEVGWPTVYPLTLTQQAEYLVRSFALSYATGAKMYLYFTFWDSDIHKAIYPAEAEFGLYNYPYSTTDYEKLAKPAWFAYKNVVELLGGKTFTGLCKVVENDPELVYALRFENKKEKICVVWQTQGESKVKVAGSPPDKILGIFGKKMSSLISSPSPIYLIWRK